MRRVSLALILALAGLALAAPSASAVSRSFFGVAEWGAPSSKSFKRLGRAKIGYVRTDLCWGCIEQRRGGRDWTYFDAVARHSANSRVSVLPTVLSSPRFVSSVPGYPPMSASARAAFAAFLRDAVRRYGPGGSFWRANPGLRQRPIRQWQIWAEPNFRAYWNGRPNAAEYVSLLRLAHGVIKGIDPRARIVTGGLPETRLGIPMRRFLRQLYQAGGRPYFDVLAIHPYARNYRGVLGAIVRARRIMRRYGDRRKRIRVSEIGWATAGSVSGRTRQFKTSLRGQAKKLRGTYRALIRRRKRYRIDGVYWFSLHDRRRRGGERNWWGINTGLIRASGRAKPAWRTLTRISRRAR
jgi:polysaccharide biosynthesis protein PslG